MHYWLVKSDPGDYSWDEFLREQITNWDGVRNYQARNYLKEMQKGDRVLFYESVRDRKIVGIAEVTKAAFPDPTANDNSDGTWVAVELAILKSLPRAVTLSQIKNDEILKDVALVKQSRLSVMPFSEKEFNQVIELSKNNG
ncbi:MAG: EVE domain-containing protein [Bacteroidota bacterium]